MKKLLLSTIVAGLAVSAAPAHAEIDLNIGGFFKGYGVYTDSSAITGATDSSNDFDFVRDTELHFTGETTLDNGLTIGAHIELEVDGADDAGLNESYAYFSGAWGRVNLGEEDGVAYLLQVAAPSADSEVDGLRAYIDGVNELSLLGISQADPSEGFEDASFALDYAQDATRNATKISYLSPVINGVQFGASYTPDDAADAGTADSLQVGQDDDDQLEAAYEFALRYEGDFEGVGVTFGAGFTHIELENEVAFPTAAAATDTNVRFEDDRQIWNIGLDLDFGPFGFGAVYSEDSQADLDVREAGVDTVFGTADDVVIGTDDEEKFVVGVDYTVGPFKLGASYLTVDNLGAIADLEADRYTAGVVYTYGPGMTLRGSVSYVEYENGDVDADATSFLIGTKVKF